MNILIVIIIATLVVAALGAGIYVLIFRARHKKEVLANSQELGGNLLVYGPAADQGVPSQPQGIFDNAGSLGQTQAGHPANPVVNDIQAPSGQDSLASSQPPQSPEPPQPSTQEAPNFETPRQEPPAVNHDFPGMSPEQRAPSSDTPIQEPAAQVNEFNLGQTEPNLGSEGNILDDTQTEGPVADIANNTDSFDTDSDITDSTVPVTKDEDIAPSPAETFVTDPVQSEPFTPPEPNTVQDFSTDQPVMPQPDANASVPEVPLSSEPAPVQTPPSETSTVPEPPQAPQTPPAPQVSSQGENTASETDNAEEGPNAQEMHI